MNKQRICKGYSINLYPTPEQIYILHEYFGVCRFVYNIGINLQEEHYKEFKEDRVKRTTLTFFEMNNKLTKLKHTEEYSWLSKYDSTSLKIVLKDVKTAYTKFFEGFCKYPKLKKKKFHHQMVPLRSDRLSIFEDHIKISFLGEVKCDRHHLDEIIGNGYKNIVTQPYKQYLNARIIFDGTGYKLTFSLEINNSNNIYLNSCKRFINNELWKSKDYGPGVGIDIGTGKNNWFVDSNNNRISRADTTKEDKRIKKYSKKLSTKVKANERQGKKTNLTLDVNRNLQLEKVNNPNYTKNELKILKKLNDSYKRKTNKNMAIMHNYINSIIETKPEYIVIEDLVINELCGANYKNSNCSAHERRLNKMLKEAKPYTFRTILTEKAEANKIEVIIADKEFPSSQICSCCGYRQKIGKTKVYKCPNCGLTIDRDLNASYNLRNLGKKDFNQYDYIAV